MNQTDLRTLEMVRRIRDEQAALLVNMSEAEIITFFRQAGKAAVIDAHRRQRTQPPNSTGPRPQPAA